MAVAEGAASASLYDWALRLGVTAVALLIYRLGCRLPVPGIDPQFIRALADSGTAVSSETLERCSIFALGVTPLFVALGLAEMLKIFVPSVRRWEQAEARNLYEFNKMVLVLGLALAIWRAREIAFGLEKSHFALGYVVPQPGPVFQIPYVVILVAAMAFLSWLADQVTRKGIGNGIWLLFIAPWLAEAPASTFRLITAQGQGELSTLQLTVGIAFVVCAIALLSGAIEADENRRPLAIWVWPFALAYGTLYVFRYLFQHTSLAWFWPGHPAYLVALGVLVAVFTLLEGRSYRLAEASSPAAGEETEGMPIVIVAAIPAILAIASELLVYQLRVPLLFDGGTVIIVTVVMLSVLDRLGLYRELRIRKSTEAEDN